MEIGRRYHTEPMARRDAYKLESKCHKIFADKRTHGEFFNIDFDSAREAVEHNALPLLEQRGQSLNLFEGAK